MNEKEALAIVVAIHGNYVFVESDCILEKNSPESTLLEDSNINTRILCTCRNKISYKGEIPKVGDSVVIESIDWANRTAVITEIKPRINFLTRPSLANVQCVFVVLSYIMPSIDIDQATRFLIAAEEPNVEVVIVLSKIDLISSEEVDIQLTQFRSWGYKSIAISVNTGEGFSALKEIIASSSISVFCGPSGVGKTSLINKLLPYSSLKEGALTKRLSRGRHTTRHVELYSFSNRIRIADSPGFNRPEFNIKLIDLQWYFPEIRNQLEIKRCKFRNCLHQEELGCAIDKNWERYLIYRRCLQDLINSPRPFQGV